MSGQQDPAGADDMPAWSFGFIKDPPEDHDGPVKPVRKITEVKLLWLSLDLWPGPYQSVPEVRCRPADT